MQLSDNFALHEFLVSGTAERHGIDMTPPPDVIANIKHLVVLCLQPLRDHLGRAIFVTSGYRPEELNTIIGGSKTSAHMDGRAADFGVAGMTPYDACMAIRDIGLPYDQNIHEFGRWVHLGIARGGRREDLTAYRRNGMTRYTPGIHKIEDLHSPDIETGTD